MFVPNLCQVWKRMLLSGVGGLAINMHRLQSPRILTNRLLSQPFMCKCQENGSSEFQGRQLWRHALYHIGSCVYQFDILREFAICVLVQGILHRAMSDLYWWLVVNGKGERSQIQGWEWVVFNEWPSPSLFMVIAIWGNKPFVSSTFMY